MDLRAELKRQLALLDLVVDAAAIDRLVSLHDLLLHWNRSYNLTAITDPQDVIEKHLVDSLTLLPCLEDNSRLLDLGSGGGFPALPVKIARPDLQVVAVDAVAKKIRFQKHVVRKLGLRGYQAWHGRAEQVPDQEFSAQGFDLVVARAFSSLPKLVELALPCLRPGGRIVAMKGPEGESELPAAAALLESNGMQHREIVEIRLPASGAKRQLLVFQR